MFAAIYNEFLKVSSAQEGKRMHACFGRQKTPSRIVCLRLIRKGITAFLTACPGLSRLAAQAFLPVKARPGQCPVTREFDVCPMGAILAFILTLGIAAPLHAQFLVRDQQFRCPPSDAKCRKTKKPLAFEFDVSESNHHPYTINYVEYTDKGALWDPR